MEVRVFSVCKQFLLEEGSFILGYFLCEEKQQLEYIFLHKTCISHIFWAFPSNPDWALSGDHSSILVTRGSFIKWLSHCYS